jgi:CRISPR system Cascade subunit CasD
MIANTLLLRLEGPLQSWGTQDSKFVVRRTGEAPTKSGVAGLLCAALGVSRADARQQLPMLNDLQMGVRIDRPGVRWWDYHTVGAGMQMRIAEGKSKPGAMLTRREYLCDASFLVCLQGDPALVNALHQAVLRPRWPMYLGRKSCPPGLPLVGRKDEPDLGEFPDLVSALRSVPWRRRLAGDECPDRIECLLEWRASSGEPEAPANAEVWYDIAQSFDVPGHVARFVIRRRFEVGEDVALGLPRQTPTATPARPRADYKNTEYRHRRQQRLDADHGLCVFCKQPAGTVQHVTYRHAGGDEQLDELRSLCRLCHDAVTMIEYGQGMTLDRIDPCDPEWRENILVKRDEIIRFRSLETRRRRLETEEVE